MGFFLVTKLMLLLSISITACKGERYDLLVRYLLKPLPANSGISVFCHLGPETAKKLFGHRTVRIGQHSLIDREILVYCINENGPQLFSTLLSTQKKLAYKNTWLIFGSEETLKVFENLVNIDISVKIYFLSASNGHLTERYQVGNVFVSNYLGNVSNEHQGVPSLNALSKTYLKQRSDFKGRSFRAVAHSASSPTIFYSKEILSNVQWRRNAKNDSVADVLTEQAMGTYADTLLILQEDLNFTTKTTVRRDDNIGYPIFVNRRFHGFNGMVGDLMTNDVDIVVAPVTLGLSRYGLIDFTHQLSTLTGALLVDANAGNYDREWLLYLLPFNTHLWVMLMANALFVLFALDTIQYMYLLRCNIKKTLTFLLGDYWMVFMSYFGRSSKTAFPRHMPPAKLMLCVIFITGNLVFISYKAALTSELSTRRQLLPFSTPKGFFDSKYRYGKMVSHGHSRLFMLLKYFKIDIHMETNRECFQVVWQGPKQRYLLDGPEVL